MTIKESIGKLLGVREDDTGGVAPYWVIDIASKAPHVVAKREMLTHLQSVAINQEGKRAAGFVSRFADENAESRAGYWFTFHPHLQVITIDGVDYKRTAAKKSREQDDEADTFGEWCIHTENTHGDPEFAELNFNRESPDEMWSGEIDDVLERLKEKYPKVRRVCFSFVEEEISKSACEAAAVDAGLEVED